MLSWPCRSWHLQLDVGPCGPIFGITAALFHFCWHLQCVHFCCLFSYKEIGGQAQRLQDRAASVLSPLGHLWPPSQSCHAGRIHLLLMRGRHVLAVAGHSSQSKQKCFKGLEGLSVISRCIICHDPHLMAYAIPPIKVEKADVNVFCFSKLWQSQIVSAPARAIDESSFVVPGLSTVASSAEGRRNFTDVQETAQWLGGEHIPQLILQDLLCCHLVLFGTYVLFQLISQTCKILSTFVCHVEATDLSSSQLWLSTPPCTMPALRKFASTWESLV